ncbi:MAG: CPBP family intramembrane glutamic endopeptidase [Campylobacterota bacterium]|nr:CPBP family intramembrane glutamic endopeptidase [Campylobacterota bacterium]
MKSEKPYPSLTQSRYYLVLELLSIYVILPTILFFFVSPPVLPLLWLVTILCTWAIFRDRTFDRKSLWRVSAFKNHSKTMFIQFVIISILLFALVYLFMPELLFYLIKENPLFWFLIIFFYPLASVYPQELLYRTFFFHRYQALFTKRWEMITINALLFGYMHIVFHNWIAILLTIGGGFLFAWMYERTRSTLLVSLAHALYGNLLFTLGLGIYFYNGTMGTIF